MTAHDDLGLPVPLSPTTRALADLALYPPRFVWPPAFRGTHEWAVLREDIAMHGIRTPFSILRNGWIIDGTHRFLIAQELRLERVPVQVIPLALARAPRGAALGLRPAPDRADGRARGDRTATPDATPGGRALPHPRRGPRTGLWGRGEPPRSEPGEPAWGASFRPGADGTDDRGVGAPIPDAPVAYQTAPGPGRAHGGERARPVQGRAAAAATRLRRRADPRARRAGSGRAVCGQADRATDGDDEPLGRPRQPSWASGGAVRTRSRHPPGESRTDGRAPTLAPDGPLAVDPAARGTWTPTRAPGG